MFQFKCANKCFDGSKTLAEVRQQYGEIFTEDIINKKIKCEICVQAYLFTYEDVLAFINAYGNRIPLLIHPAFDIMTIEQCVEIYVNRFKNAHAYRILEGVVPVKFLHDPEFIIQSAKIIGWNSLPINLYARMLRHPEIVLEFSRKEFISYSCKYMRNVHINGLDKFLDTLLKNPEYFEIFVLNFGDRDAICEYLVQKEKFPITKYIEPVQRLTEQLAEMGYTVHPPLIRRSQKSPLILVVLKGLWANTFQSSWNSRMTMDIDENLFRKLLSDICKSPYKEGLFDSIFRNIWDLKLSSQSFEDLAKCIECDSHKKKLIYVRPSLIKLFPEVRITTSCINKYDLNALDYLDYKKLHSSTLASVISSNPGLFFKKYPEFLENEELIGKVITKTGKILEYLDQEKYKKYVLIHIGKGNYFKLKFIDDDVVQAVLDSGNHKFVDDIQSYIKDDLIYAEMFYRKDYKYQTLFNQDIQDMVNKFGIHGISVQRNRAKSARK